MSTQAIERVGPRVAPVLVLALGALALRNVATWSFLVPVAGAAGVLAVQPDVRVRADRLAWLAITSAGVATFALVRIVLPGAPMHATAFGVTASVIAAVAEEIVFRRGLYGALARWGPAVAIVVTALVFGVVHAPMYGWAVVPVDVGAGLVLGWQRWASGGWTSPAVTHVSANLMAAI